MKAFLLFILASVLLLSSNSFSQSLRKSDFIENKGQWNKEALFVGSFNNGSVIITKDAMIFDYQLRSSAANSVKIMGQVIKFAFPSQFRNAIGIDKKNETMNFMKGSTESEWITGVRKFGSVLLDNVYPGVDLSLKFENNSPRYDFILKPGADPSRIIFNIEGADFVKTTDSPSLLVGTRFGDIEHKNLYAYQDLQGQKNRIECSFILKDGKISFKLGDYDKSLPLIIDPTALSTFFGGTANDEIVDIINLTPNSFVIAGFTESIDIYTTPGAYDVEYKGGKDGFISKVKNFAADFTVEFSTFIGGSSDDVIKAIAKDAAGNIYATGYTTSADFPSKGFQLYKYMQEKDAFALKINPVGDSIMYSLIMGASKDEVSNDISVGPTGMTFFGGYTNSHDFTSVGAPLYKTKKLLKDGFIARISPSGGNIDFCGFYSGNGDDEILSIYADDDGFIYMTGITNSSDIPVAPYLKQGSWLLQVPYDYTANGGTDGFLAKMNSSGSVFEFSTYFGGSSDDYCVGLRPHSDGTYVFAGVTKKEIGSNPTFPIVGESLQPVHGGGLDIFFGRLDKPQQIGWQTVHNLISSTFIGGSNDDVATGMISDATSTSYTIYGYSASSGYPIKSDENNRHNGAKDVIITNITQSSKDLNFSYFFGGNRDDIANAFCYDAKGNHYLVGSTTSLNFPVNNAVKDKFTGLGSDGFITKIVPGSLSLIQPSGGDKFCPGTEINFQWDETSVSEKDTLILQYSHKGTNDWHVIFNMPVAKSYKWRIPDDFEPGNDYIFRLSHIYGISTTINDPVEIYAKPQIISSQIPEILSICEGQPFNVKIVGKGSGITYAWKKNGQNISFPADSVLYIDKLALSDSGSYQLFIRGVCYPEIKSEIIKLNVIPATRITTDPKDISVNEGNSFTLTVDAVGDNLSYQWLKDGNAIFGATSKSYSITASSSSDNGLYSAIVAGTCGKDTSASSTVSIVTGIYEDNSPKRGDFFISLAGSSDSEISLNLSSDVYCDVNITLIDILGVKVADVYKGSVNQGVNLIKFSNPALSNGVYWIVANCGSRKASLKLNYSK